MQCPFVSTIIHIAFSSVFFCVFVCVDRVYQKFQDKIMMGVNEANFVRKFLFNKAFDSKVDALKNGTEPSAFWEKVVFSKVKAKFGGRIKACVSGSARCPSPRPIS